MSSPIQRDSGGHTNSLVSPTQGSVGHKTLSADSISAKPNTLDNAQKSPATKEPMSVGSVRSIHGMLGFLVFHVTIKVWCFCVTSEDELQI